MTSTDSQRLFAVPSADPAIAAGGGGAPDATDAAPATSPSPEGEGVSALTLEERKKLAENLDDPLNRWYRYPIARWLLKVIGGLPLRPDHITYIHIGFGTAAAGLVAYGERWALLVAFVFLEIRDVLDCYDGVLARAKKMSSPRGRALDEAADAISFIMLTIAIAYLGIRRHPEIPAELYGAFGLFAVIAGAFCAHACDFYKRRLGTALKEGRDGVKEELEIKRAQKATEKVGPLTNFGIWVDRWQYIYWDPTYANGDPVKTVLARAHRPGVKFMATFVGLMSWDNGIFILHIGLLTGFLFESWVVSVGFALTAILIARITATAVLGGRASGEKGEA